MTDGNGNTTQYPYIGDHQLSQVTEASGTTLKYGYDSAGNLTSETDGSEPINSLGYNALNQWASVTNPLNQTTAYTYGGGKPPHHGQPGRADHHRYLRRRQRAHRRELLGHTAPNVTNITYNPDGQMTGMTDGTGTSAWTYGSLSG